MLFLTFPFKQLNAHINYQIFKIMKKVSIFFISLLISGVALAQSNKEDVDIIQSVLGKEKKALVADFLKLEAGPKTDAFWKQYDEYETERKALGRERIALLEK